MTARILVRLRPLLPALGFFLAVVLLFNRELFHGKVVYASGFLRNRAPFNSAAPEPPPFSRRRFHGDVVTAIVPFQAFASEEWRHGRIPTWLPWQLGGTPYLEDVSGAFFPGLLLAAPFPVSVQLTLDILLRLLISGVGMVLLLRRWKLGPVAQATGAVAWTFGWMMTFWLGWLVTNVAAMLPWMVLATEAVLETPGAASFAGLAAAAAMSILGGNSEMNAHLWPAVGLFFALRLGMRARAGITSPRASAIAAGVALAGVAVGALVAGVHLFPFLEILGRSALWHERPDLGEATIPLDALRLLVAPDAWGYLSYVTDPATHPPTFDITQVQKEVMTAYIGLSALALVPAAFFSAARRPIAISLTAVSVAILGATYGVPGFHQLFRLLPLLSKTYVERMLFIPAFGFAALAAMGAEAVVAERDRRAILSVVISGVILAIASIAVLAVTPCPYPASRGWAPVAGAIAIAAAVFLAKQDETAAWLLPSIVALELVSVFGAYAQWSNPSEVMPRGPEMRGILAQTGGSLGVYDGIYPPSLSAGYGVRDMRAYDPMASLRWRTFYDRLDPSMKNEPRNYLFMGAPDPEWLRIAGVDRFLTGGAPSPGASWAQSRPNPTGAQTPLHGKIFRQPLACHTGTALQVHAGTGRVHAEIHVLDDHGAEIPIAGTAALAQGVALARFARGVPCPATLTLEIRAADAIDLPAWPRADNDPDGPLSIDGTATKSALFAAIWTHPFHADRADWQDPLVILHDPGTRPFVWLAERAVPAAGLNAALDAVARELPAKDRWVELEGAPAEAATPLAAEEFATSTRPSPTRIDIDANATRARWLVVQESTDPGWIATVDGAPAPLLPANAVWQAVRLEPGKHHVELDYRPKSLRLGALASLAGLAIVGAALARKR